jgi:hypothetical protein
MWTCRQEGNGNDSILLCHLLGSVCPNKERYQAGNVFDCMREDIAADYDIDEAQEGKDKEA